MTDTNAFLIFDTVAGNNCNIYPIGNKYIKLHTKVMFTRNKGRLSNLTQNCYDKKSLVELITCFLLIYDWQKTTKINIRCIISFVYLLIDMAKPSLIDMAKPSRKSDISCEFREKTNANLVIWYLNLTEFFVDLHRPDIDETIPFLGLSITSGVNWWVKTAFP